MFSITLVGCLHQRLEESSLLGIISTDRNSWQMNYAEQNE